MEYLIRGQVKREDDPMYDPTKSGQVRKHVLSAESLAESLVRWTKLGRIVEHVDEVENCPILTGPDWLYGEQRPKLAAAVLSRYPYL